jgi:hypothetical protein
MSNPFTYSFGAIAFHPLAQDWMPLVSPPKLAYSVRHIPYSDFQVLDQGGKTERRYKHAVLVAGGDVGAWEAMLGTTDVLTVAGVEWPSATLVDLGEHTMTPYGDRHQYQPEWVVG